MASIWEKAISILAGNLNSSCSYLITAVLKNQNLYLKEEQMNWNENPEDSLVGFDIDFKALKREVGSNKLWYY